MTTKEFLDDFMYKLHNFLLENTEYKSEEIITKRTVNITRRFFLKIRSFYEKGKTTDEALEFIKTMIRINLEDKPPSLKKN